MADASTFPAFHAIKTNHPTGPVLWQGESESFPITLRGRDGAYAVGYGFDIRGGLTYETAALELGIAILHLSQDEMSVT